MRRWNCRRIKYICCILTPFALLPLAISASKESRCAYIIFWMAVYWVLEPVDITVTALLPVPLMPLLGILNAEQVASNYMKEVLVMFVGGLGVAVAVEYCNLHERVALKVLLTLGSEIKWLLLGFMLTTMFLSMWISNTASTAMMIPIIEALMAELREKEDENEGTLSSEELNLMHKTLLLAVAYSANCGGTGTITGTSPNMVFVGYIEEFYPKSQEITYGSWMVYNIPGMILCVLTAWLVLQIVYFPFRKKQNKENSENITNVILNRYKKLGKLTFHEKATLTLFIILVFLWIFREPKFIPGWADILASDKKVGDAVPAIGILFILMMFPVDPRRPHKSDPPRPWRVVQEKLPWGLVLLLGGGYALSMGAKESGLSKWIGREMTVMSFLHPTAVLIILCITTTALTEIMSNSTVTTMLLPVVNQMALAFKVNPLYLMLPLAVVSSYAFMLPVATGPNALIFGTKHLKTMDMVKPGIIINICALIIQLIMIHTLGSYLFSLGTFPDWAQEHGTSFINVTDVGG